MQLRINTLTADLAVETLGRGRFGAFSPPDFPQAAETLIRYWLSTIAAARQADKVSRRMFFTGSARLGGKNLPGGAVFDASVLAFCPICETTA